MGDNLPDQITQSQIFSLDSLSQHRELVEYDEEAPLPLENYQFEQLLIKVLFDPESFDKNYLLRWAQFNIINLFRS